MKGLAAHFLNDYYKIKRVWYGLRKETSSVQPSQCTKTFGFYNLRYLGTILEYVTTFIY